MPLQLKSAAGRSIQSQAMLTKQDSEYPHYQEAIPSAQYWYL